MFDIHEPMDVQAFVPTQFASGPVFGGKVKEFKRETVRLIIREWRKVKQVAEELGMNYWTVKGWIKQYGRQEQADLVAKGLKMTPEEENGLLEL